MSGAKLAPACRKAAFSLPAAGALGALGWEAHWLAAPVVGLGLLRWTEHELALALLAVGTVGAAVWAMLLRRRVQEQTGLLTRRLQRIAALEEHYQELFENANDMVFTCDLRGQFTSLNWAGERITGLSRREAAGMTVAGLAAPEYTVRAERMLVEGARPEGGETVALEILTRQGRRVSLEIRLRPVLAEGKVVELQGIARDITERRLAEQALRKSEARFRRLAESNMIGVIVGDESGRFVDANDAYLNMVGYTRQDLEAGRLRWDSIVPPDRKSVVEEVGRKLRATGVVEPFESAHLHKDGRRVPILVGLARLEGEKKQAIGFVLDLTERKRAERALEERTAYLHSLVENTPLAIVVCDAQGRIELSNSAFERLFLCKGEEILGANIDDLVAPEDAKTEAVGFTRRAYSGENFRAVCRRRRTDGTLVDVELHGVPLILNGELAGIYGLYEDIGERLRAEEELRNAKATAEAANRAKSEFLANMSHEIRTPMNCVIGMTELALDTSLDPQQREYLGMVKESADSLLTLLNDILDFSKIEAGKLALDITEFDLRDNLGHTIKTLAPRAHQKNLELVYEIAPDVPTALRGDPTRLRQIVVNLLSNAIKFTHQGEVLLSVGADAVSDEEVSLHGVVKDTGIGIPVEKLRVIFDAFAQADGSMTREYGGTGLGLAISRQLVEMMGGRIRVESVVGRGSEFHFTARLGRQRVPAETHAAAESVELRGLRVLVADDNAAHRSVLASMLKCWKMEPVLAEGGAAGLALMTENKQSGRTFPLALLDAQMPDLDGFALAEAVRRDSELAGATIMMLTSAGQRGDAARCRELGIGAYLIKPIRQSELLDAILTTLGKPVQMKGKAPLVTRHALREARRKLRILVVEDNPVNRQLAARLLEKQGHDVALAANGPEALELLEQSFTGFDVAVMDVQMPEMDGLEATARIRAKEKATGRHLPIVAMTARAMKGDRERCLAAGMDGYIAKPIRPDALFAEIEAVSSGAPQAAELPGGGVPEADDRAALVARMDGDEQLLSDLAGLFVRNSQKLMEEISDAAARHDARRLEFAAHQMKGSAANFGARAVCAAAERLEGLGRGSEFSAAAEALQELRKRIERLLPELEKLRKGEKT